MPLIQRLSRFAIRPVWRFGFHLWLLLLAAGCRPQAAGLPPGASSSAVKVMVETDGMVRVSLASLRQAGLALSAIAADEVSLSHAGDLVPFLGNQRRHIRRRAWLQLRHARTGRARQEEHRCL